MELTFPIGTASLYLYAPGEVFAAGRVAVAASRKAINPARNDLLETEIIRGTLADGGGAGHSILQWHNDIAKRFLCPDTVRVSVARKRERVYCSATVVAGTCTTERQSIYQLRRQKINRQTSRNTHRDS